jgi:acyl-homoserine-lactone acylase
MPSTPLWRRALLPLAAIAALAGCATPPPHTPADGVIIQRTAYGVPHVSAPDLGLLGLGIGYAYAQDNVCQTADALLSARGERSRFLGGATVGLLARRNLPNEVIDTFVTAHMDDAALARAWQTQASPEARALMTGYVEGWNRWLAENHDRLPAECAGQPWVRPMTQADAWRLGEVTMAQAGVMALADAVVGAQPPVPPASARRPSVKVAEAADGAAHPVDLAAAAEAMRAAGVLDSPLGSNAWAFGRETTADGRGVLFGNPHFPWVGPNRFWQMHLTVPGRLDAMGASIGHFPAISVGFNRDVAWSNTVSTGKRFTLHELTLAPGDPTAYLVDGQPEKMRSREVKVTVRNADGSVAEKTRRLWSTRWGPVLVIPAAGLQWTATRAYAIQDVNAGQARGLDTYLAVNRARSVGELRQALRTLGSPWVNFIAADRHGDALYADVSTVPDVDAAQLERCAPSPPAAALRRAAGLVVLDGSRSDCGWKRDPASAQPGAIPFERMPSVVRADWVQNSNDSFWYTHPSQRFDAISPLVGDAALTRPRTRASHLEIQELLDGGKVTPQRVAAQFYQDRNLIARMVMPDLLTACSAAAPADADVREGCAALRGWDQRNAPEARGAHLFREFWRPARNVRNVWRVPFDPAQPVATPNGLRMDDPAVRDAVWKALGDAVRTVRAAGFALDAPLSSVLRSVHGDPPIGLHGGDEYVGVLNNIGQVADGPIGPRGIVVDYGTSYVQVVGFDERGPVADALLTFGQSPHKASPHATDQTRLFAQRRWVRQPFHPEDVAAQRLGEVVTLRR